MTEEILEPSCPYCGEIVDLHVDTSGGDSQQYVEDCPVCCRPWHVWVDRSVGGEWQATLRTMDE